MKESKTTSEQVTNKYNDQSSRTGTCILHEDKSHDTQIYIAHK